MRPDLFLMVPNLFISPNKLKEGDIIFESSLGISSGSLTSARDIAPKHFVHKVKTASTVTHVAMCNVELADMPEIAPIHVESYFENQSLHVYRYSLKNLLKKL